MSANEEQVRYGSPPISAEDAGELGRQVMQSAVTRAIIESRQPNPVVDVDSTRAASTLAEWLNTAVFSVRNEEREGFSGKRHRHPDNEDKRSYVADDDQLIAQRGASNYLATGVQGADGSYDLSSASKGAFIWTIVKEYLAREDPKDDEPFYFLFGAVCLGPGQWTLVRFWFDQDSSEFQWDSAWYVSRRKRTPRQRTTAARRSRR